jgi:nitrate/nitrite transporter NarK
MDTLGGPANVLVEPIEAARGRVTHANPSNPRRFRLTGLSRNAWTVWAAAVTVYFVAVFHRSSLGVAGIIAAHRFGISASQLAAFTVLQLVVYAGMQIPVGLLVDRFGPRRLLCCGLVIMTTAQLGFAFGSSFDSALAARALLGCGDAMTFISVLRVISAWFPARRAPLVTQLTGFTGTAGNLLSAYPLSVALRDFGWTPAYAAAAVIGGCAIVFPLLVVRDRPSGAGAGIETGTGTAELASPAAQEREPVLAQLRACWSQTGTRLGLWIHFTTPFSSGVFGLLWGYPFLVSGEGVAPSLASGLLTLLVAEAMACGPLYGYLTGRRPSLCLPIAFAVIGMTATVWAAVLLWPGRAPLWLIVVLIMALGAGGPASLIGFEVARPANAKHRLGTMSGMVNIGGFTAMVLLLVAIGVILDAVGSGSGGHYSLAGFKAAFAFQYVLFALGTARIVRLSRRLRAEA